MKHKIHRTQTRADTRAEVSETVTQSRPRQLIRDAGRLKFGPVSSLSPSDQNITADEIEPIVDVILILGSDFAEEIH